MKNFQETADFASNIIEQIWISRTLLNTLGIGILLWMKLSTHIADFNQLMDGSDFEFLEHIIYNFSNTSIVHLFFRSSVDTFNMYA